MENHFILHQSLVKELSHVGCPTTNFPESDLVCVYDNIKKTNPTDVCVSGF